MEGTAPASECLFFKELSSIHKPSELSKLGQCKKPGTGKECTSPCPDDDHLKDIRDVQVQSRMEAAVCLLKSRTL